jgi:hypothetical protein
VAAVAENHRLVYGCELHGGPVIWRHAAIDYLRHHDTEYDRRCREVSHGLRPQEYRRQVHLIRARFLAEIGSTYPWLQRECEQMIHASADDAPARLTKVAS